VIDGEIGFLQECAAEGVLRVVGRAAEGEVRCCVWVDGVGGLKIEGCVGEGNVDALAAGDFVAEGEGDGRVELC